MNSPTRWTAPRVVTAPSVRAPLMAAVFASISRVASATPRRARLNASSRPSSSAPSICRPSPRALFATVSPSIARAHVALERRSSEARHRSRRSLVALANVLGDGRSAGDSEDASESEEESTRASVQLPRTRRRVQMTFTCNKCEGRTMRMINPDVLERGTMWVQCGQCEVWHQVIDNLGLIFDFTGDYDELKNVVKNAKWMRPPSASD